MNQEKWTKLADEFYSKWQFPNCIGTIDGKHIKIRCPSNSGSDFLNYKQYFSIILLATCDAQFKFTWVDIRQCGKCDFFITLTFSKDNRENIKEI